MYPMPRLVMTNGKVKKNYKVEYVHWDKAESIINGWFDRGYKVLTVSMATVNIRKSHLEEKVQVVIIFGKMGWWEKLLKYKGVTK